MILIFIFIAVSALPMGKHDFNKLRVGDTFKKELYLCDVQFFMKRGDYSIYSKLTYHKNRQETVYIIIVRDKDKKIVATGDYWPEMLQKLECRGDRK